jgi:2-methylisocitrate lyase-like PEP mutase family enzyme
MSNQHAAAAAFRALHRRKPGFIMPNAWDAGSAIVLAAEGFEAIATTSAGIAFALGRQDYQVSAAHLAVSRAQMFARMREIADATALPVNGDLEAGYGERPEEVAATIEDAIAAGLAGGNIEDKPPLEAALYDEALAVERIAAARARIAALGNGFVLTARTDAFLTATEDPLRAAIRRANRFLDAGADCVYAPGPSDPAIIATLVKEIGGPINVVMGLGTAAGNAHALIAAGVQRISLGGSIARAALGFVRRSARELRERGTLDFATGQIPQAELNTLFAGARGADQQADTVSGQGASGTL